MAQGTPLTKVCQHCGEEKRLSEYYENKTKPDKRSGVCKTCQGELDRKNRGKS